MRICLLSLSSAPLLHFYTCYQFLLKSILTSSQCRHVLTGSYHNFFRIFDTDSSNDVVLQADKSAFKAKKIGVPPGKNGLKNGPRPGGLRDAMQTDTLDFNKKILHASWHPRENTIAVSIVLYLGFGLYTDPLTLDRCDKQLVLIQRSIIHLSGKRRQAAVYKRPRHRFTHGLILTLHYHIIVFTRFFILLTIRPDTTHKCVLPCLCFRGLFFILRRLLVSSVSHAPRITPYPDVHHDHDRKDSCRMK